MVNRNVRYLSRACRHIPYADRFPTDCFHHAACGISVQHSRSIPVILVVFMRVLATEEGEGVSEALISLRKFSRFLITLNLCTHV
jgi:hypothetical protein